MQSTIPLTYRLGNGREVLAKSEAGELVPVRYANQTQAEARRSKLGAGWELWQGQGRAIYIARKET